jgi:PAS domain S-box-containing protein
LRRLFVGTPLYTKQAVSLLIGVCLPWAWNIIYVFNLIAVPRKDLTPVMFTISGLAVALGLVRYHLFTTVPFAREFIVRQLNDGVFIFDIRNCLVEANPMALKISGADEQIVGKKLEDLLPISPFFSHLNTGSNSREELTLDVSGEKRIFELEITPMSIQKDHPAGRLVILHDVTERKKSEEQYRLIAENSADIIYKVNLKTGEFTFVSPSVEKVLGYTEKEALSLKIKDVLTPESFERQRQQMIKDLQAGHLQSTLELNAIHKDGRIIPVEVHASLICDAKGTPVEFVGVARDITERKKMENQLVMQDRLAAIGQLASGVAHELNNPLTAVINYSTILLKKELPEDIQQDVKEIHEEALRTANIVKNLLTFAGKQRLDKELINIIQNIQKVLELRAYEQRVNNIHTTVRANTELPMVLGNSSQIQQVFFNIIINAEFFMTQAHKKGNLTITAEKAEDMVKITFADDGPGISKEDINNIFTPFFTTKDAGKGTGLSLSICLSIINEHGGKIWVESEQGKGTTFFIELPAFHQDERDENS